MPPNIGMGLTDKSVTFFAEEREKGRAALVYSSSLMIGTLLDIVEMTEAFEC